MSTMMTRERLEEVFDQVAREVTRKTTGICLHEGTEAPSGNLCTVYVKFGRGVHTCVSLCAEDALFTRLTQHMMRSSKVTPQDVEDFSKEFFNVLCGHLAFGIFHATNVRPRFSTPVFYRGRYIPDNHDTHFTLSYTSDERENVQLIHHTPIAMPQQGTGCVPSGVDHEVILS